MQPAPESAPPATRPAPGPPWTLDASPTLRSLVFFGLYVVQGIPSGFALTAVVNYLNQRRVDPLVVGAFTARIGIPWSVQFLWGPVIDRFQGSPMGRRKPWVLGAQLAAFVASLGVIGVRDPVGQVGLLSLAFLVHGLFASIQDASVDAMAISIIPESERGRVNACMRAGIMVGSGVGAAVWSRLMADAGFTAAAVAQSAVLLAMTLITAFVRERPGDALVPWGRRRGPVAAEAVAAEPAPAGGLAGVVRELARGFFAPRSLVIFGLVVVVSTGMSVFIQAYPRHLAVRLGWRAEELSAYQGTGGTVVALLTVALAFVLADRVGPRRLVVAMIGVIGGFLVGFDALGGHWSSPGVAAAGLVLWYMMDPGFSVGYMPVLMGLCRPGVEGSQFTAYMALVNLTGALAGLLAGGLQERFEAPAIGLATGLVVLATLPVMAWALRRDAAAARGGLIAATPGG